MRHPLRSSWIPQAVALFVAKPVLHYVFGIGDVAPGCARAAMVHIEDHGAVLPARIVGGDRITLNGGYTWALGADPEDWLDTGCADPQIKTNQNDDNPAMSGVFCEHMITSHMNST